MVRGPEEQFAHKIEKIRFDEGFVGEGSVVTKQVKSSDGYENGPYAYLVSPSEHGREWFYLGKYEKEIDLEERIEMDYNRLLFRYEELGQEWAVEAVGEDRERYNTSKETIVYKDGLLQYIRPAKEGELDWREAIHQTVFGRDRCPVRLNPESPKEKLRKLLLEHIVEEVNDIHLPDGESLPFELESVLAKKAEWGRTPYNYEQYEECVESGTEPDFVN